MEKLIPALTLTGNFPINHVSFAVADIEEAVDQWVKLLGAGPFFRFENIQFDFATHKGAPCTFAHSAAFGQCGPIAIEFQQIHEASPPALASKLISGPLPAINHVGYVSNDAARESDRLTAMGFELFLHAGAGEMEVRFHDTSAVLGYAIEIHRRCDFIENFFIGVAAAAVGWDGKDPIRTWDAHDWNEQ